MRVALFSNTIDVTNGYGNITYEYCTALHKKGVECVLFLPHTEKGLAESMSLPFEVRPILSKYMYRLFQDPLLLVFRKIDVSEFDIVHSLFGFPFCITALRSAKKYGKPFMMGEQGTYAIAPFLHYPEKNLFRKCLRAAKKIIVPSEYTKKVMQEYANETFDIDVVHNGVDVSRFQKDLDISDLKKQYEGKKLLLTVGQIKERKGQDLVVKALPKIVKECPTAHYVVVGTGPMQSELEELAESLGVSDHLEFVGVKKGDELVKYYQASDLYIHTPRVKEVYFEGFGIVYLEAGAAGKPVVAAAAGGVADAVEDQTTGIIAPDGDVDAIAEAAIRILQDPELQKAYGEQGKKHAEEHSWENIVDQFLPFYEECISG